MESEVDCMVKEKPMAKITRESLMSLETYARERKVFREHVLAHKKSRSVHLGEHLTLLYEDETTIRYQIQEMLRIEKGGAAQVPDELAAYDPMVPKGSELTATLLFEVADPVKRDAFLRTIGGVEDHIALQVGGETIRARAEGDVERTRESDGKASAVHFVHFDFTPSAVAAWKSGEGQAMVVIDHPNYGHAALIGAEARAYLARECF